MIGFLEALVIFVPGMILLSFLAKTFGNHLNRLEVVLYGAITWNYFFVIFGVIVGSFSGLIVPYFAAFGIVSVAIAIAASVLLLITSEVRKPSLVFHREKLLFVIVLSLLLGFSLFVAYFHTIFVEWDAISDYIPQAKSILLTGGLSNQPYMMLNFFGFSPTMPVIYAYMLNYSDYWSLYNIPILYFSLTLVAMYLISKRLFDSTIASFTLLAFLSIPTVILTLASRWLYLDIPFVMYFLGSLYAAIKISITGVTRNGRWIDFSVFGMSLSLLLLTRIEFGIFLVPLFVSSLFIAMNQRFSGAIVGLAVGLPYYLREVVNIIFDFHSWLLYLEQLIPVIIVSVFAVALVRRFGQETHDEFHGKWRLFALSIVLMIPSVLYVMGNIIVHGFIFAGESLWNVELLASGSFFRQIFSSSLAAPVSPLKFGNLVLVWWFIIPYAIPILIAVAYLAYLSLKGKTISRSFLIFSIFMCGILSLWATLGYDTQPRRLYYLVPLASILVVYSISRIKGFLQLSLFKLRSTMYVALVTTCVILRIGPSSANSLSLLYGELYQPNVDLELTIVCAILFLVVFAPYERIPSVFVGKVNFPVYSLVPLSIACLIVISSLSGSLLPLFLGTDVSNNTSRSEYKSGWMLYPDVVNYYNDEIRDHCTTLVFYGQDLVTFANRTVIDLSGSVYGSPIYSTLRNCTYTDLLHTLAALNVRYFLAPNPNEPSFYTMFQTLVNSTSFSYLFQDKLHFGVLKVFKYVTLYKLHQNFTTEVLTPTSYSLWVFNIALEHTITVLNQSIVVNATTDDSGILELMEFFKDPVRIGDALQITMNCTTRASVLHVILCDNVQDTSKNFLVLRSALGSNTTTLTFGINEGATEGYFDPQSITGIVIGIEASPNTQVWIGISTITTVVYGD
jgi:hypothetical protein